MFVPVHNFSVVSIEMTIKNREKEIRRLKRKAARLASHSALQSLQLIKRAEYLQALNQVGRGPSLPPIQRIQHPDSVRLW
jgi:septal ring factor EnvC (AmiA/AmiB activator)